MRCVIQRVAQASVSVAGEQIGAIQQGFMVLIGVSTDDTDHDVHYMAEKVPNPLPQGCWRRDSCRQPVHTLWRCPRRPPPQLYRGGAPGRSQ